MREGKGYYLFTKFTYLSFHGQPYCNINTDGITLGKQGHQYSPFQ
jgi:hypothetical protein